MTQAVFDFSAIGRVDTLSHELGHVLGLGHNNFGAGGTDNLMTSGRDGRIVAQALGDVNPDGLGLEKLTAEQIAQARSSGYTSSEARSSASGRYVLDLRFSANANAHVAPTTASLWEASTSPRQLLWTRKLAHRPRPRFVLVGDQGQVVLLDEWLPVRSELAVILIDKNNRSLAVHGLEAVRDVTLSRR